MWLIHLGKVVSVIYLVFAYWFAFGHFAICAAERPLPSGEIVGLSGSIFILIPVSWLIPWAAHKLKNRLFEDVNFDEQEWKFYPHIVLGSWLIYVVCLLFVVQR